MNDRDERTAPFDESAALAELARLRQAIERRREEREAAAGKFEEFLQSFPAEAARVEPAHSPPPAPAAPPRPTPVVPLVAAPMPPAAPRPRSPIAAAPRPRSPIAAAPRPRPPIPAAPRKPAAGTSWRRAVVLLLAVGALGLWLWRQQAGSGGTASPVAASPAAESATAATPDPVPIAAPQPAQGTAAEAGPERATPTGSLQMEITTTRLVWLRVVADGERVLERQLPAASRVPVTAEKTIVIRTGDAGAVRVSVGGRDQGFLGAAGRVVTRTFTPGGEDPR